jgi:hypothetical protein
MSQILLGFMVVLSAGILHVQFFEVQAGLVIPFLLAASTRNNNAVTCTQEPLILQKQNEERS